MRLPGQNTFRFYVRVLKDSVVKFWNEDVLTQSAALSFYMIFSFPSILLIVLWTAARFYREVAVREAVFAEIGDLVGQEGARELIGTVERIDIAEPTWWATAVGIGVLLFTASNVLVTTQTVLNRIFEVDTTGAEGLGVWVMLRDRLVSFALLITISLMLLVLLVVDALIAAFGTFAAKWLGAMSTYLMVADALLLDLGATTLLFALFLRYLPDAALRSPDIWFGALLTTVLFTAGKYAIGFVIGSSTTADLYEAAGSVLVLMLWVYYASAIFLFGATFTFTRAKLLGGVADARSDRALHRSGPRECEA